MSEGSGVTTAKPLQGYDQYLTGIDLTGDRTVYHYKLPRAELNRALASQRTRRIAAARKPWSGSGSSRTG